MTNGIKTEKQVEKYLNTLVKINQGISYKFISTVKGVPDRIIIINKKVAFVEVKSLEKFSRLSPLQVVQLERIRSCGIIATVVRNYQDCDELINLLIKD